jgi:hypothetical protein
MNEHETHRIGDDLDAHSARKLYLRTEITKLTDSIHTLKKQKQVPVIVTTIEQLERDLESLQQELAGLEKIV